MSLYKRPIRTYLDTTVFGGIMDEEFAKYSYAFFQEVRLGRFLLVVSAVVEAEIAEAPIEVQRLLDEMFSYAEVVLVTEEAEQLAQAYLDAKVVRAKSEDDALHVATASVSECDLIVSWNFRDIVHFGKIQRYNAVNALNGYGSVAIHSPREVIEDEEDL